MAIELPAPIEGYFTADRDADADAITRHFTEHAIVRDEGHSYVGRQAIRQWKRESSTKYTYTAEPFALSDERDITVLSAHLTGDFPGSPIDLRYRFKLEGAHIAALDIVV